MSDIIITAENLSKRYIIGRQRDKGDGLRHVIENAVRAPFGWLRRAWNGTTPSVPETRSGDSAPVAAPSTSRFRSSEEFWALRDVSIEIQEGEVVGIIGRNGAGKSTLLKILSRITEPTAGKIHLRGRVSSLLEVGTGFHPELTGRENVFLNGAILGMTKAEMDRKFDEIVAFSEVEKFLDTPVKRYSTGMYLRLAFAVAAHLEPEILIVDEILAVGDTSFQKKCLGKMEAVSRAGRTVLFVSHNLNAVRELCDRAIILDSGRLIFDGGIDEGVDAYLSSVRVAAKKDATTRKDRSGSGKVRIQQVEISAGDKATERGLVTGSAARFVFHLDRALEAVDCVFTIYDEKGMAVVSFQSEARAPDDERVGSCFDQIVCEIEEFLLLPGTYHLNAALCRKGEILDRVEGLSVFEVSPGSIRGRILDKTSKFGSLHVPHRWCMRAKPVEPGPAELKG